MVGRAAVMLMIVAGVSGCRQIFGLSDLPADASVAIDTPDADTSNCPTLGLSCAGPDTLRSCTTLGQPANDTTCRWGCTPTGGAHCGALAPTGGGVTAMDVTDTTGLASVLLSGITTIDDTGSISGVRGSGVGVTAGVGFHVAGNIAIYTFSDLTINNTINFTGTHPIALVSTTTLSVGALGYLNLTGQCQNNVTSIAGGYNGGAPSSDGTGPGGGAQGVLGGGGGGGGGFGALGGSGGKGVGLGNAAAGAVFGTPELATLVGGGGGGGGDGTNGAGGGGGGAVQLVADGTLTISGRINAGGCGAHRGGNGGGGGGGGGAGGAILLEAHDIVMTATALLAVNGGAGGGGDAGPNGQDGQPNQTAAIGGSGGTGGAVAKITGGDGDNNNGGGGAVGRIRFNTKDGTVSTLTDAMSSPTQSQSPTTTTIGTAAIQ